MNLENYQEEICKLCENHILDAENMTSTFMCEGRFCSDAKELYLEDNEIWIDIKGFENIYQISSFGNVMSFWFGKEKILKPQKVGGGYHAVSLYKKGCVIRVIPIHKLIAIYFYNHKPNGFKIVVDHIDNDKLNNHVNNIQLISHRKNTSKDQKKHNRSSQYVGVDWSKKDKKWRARILINGNRKYLGCFKNEIDAHLAYQKELNNIIYL